MAKKIIIKNIPRHVGVIMDGNGRWATALGQKRSYGHKEGAKTVVEVVKTFVKKGVEFVSLYAFSTENFSRPKEEVDFLFETLKKGIAKYGEECLKLNARLIVSGDLSVLDGDLQKVIEEYSLKTQVNKSPVLNICLNYGARQELCRAFNQMIEKGETNATPEVVEKYLYGADSQLPSLDLVIRTGGEKRLSNFMLWQASYAELYFTDVLWPDFSKEECLKALEWFSSRKRRFGKIDNA